MPGPMKVKGTSKPQDMMGTLKRLIKELFVSSGKKLIVVGVSLIIAAIGMSAGSVYTINMLDVIMQHGSTKEQLFSSLGLGLGIMAIIYVFSWTANFIYPRLMAIITHKYLNEIRKNMFANMEKLPIRYFDTHKHGDIMSMYTNDVDAIRQLVSQALPQLFTSGITALLVFVIMIYYSLWLTLIVVGVIVIMLFVVKVVGGNSAKYFIAQQQQIGKTEGYMEEMIHGQKVVKVFCHEEEAKKKFDVVNDELNVVSAKANTYANILMPILGNLGNIMYILVAIVGSLIIAKEGLNVGISGITRDPVTLIPIIVGFLGMGRMFAHQIQQVSQQVNAIAMALAGAERIYKLLEEKPEEDNGYVSLVRAKYDADGNIIETDERTGIWAWKHPHQADGTITYVPLKGDIEMVDVDFGYVPEKIVLHDVSLHATPGEKYAFVGATGAGKTTITNLLTRFYDIADGKIRYDGININKIKKGDLRLSIAMVLQDTNLFTGTIKENIRFGRQDATDEEIIEAAKIASAHDFITRLPDGYDTMLTNDGSNLSQGQRQLISIARAAVADAPVMIMDEATSSIDTRTERLVQKGTDQLMQGRTTFVIAHRLSTIHNSNTIMVLDHGHVVERGTHEELIEKKGMYYQLYTGQFELE